jgi:hypothetical protein
MQPSSPPSQALPLLYELMIDGECFLVELDQVVKLSSKQQPAKSYQVALRVAPTQRLRLGGFQFDYDRHAKVQTSEGQGRPSARLTHELGFSLIVSDLGGPLNDNGLDEVMSVIAESVTETFQQKKAAKLEASPPQKKKFAGSSGREVVVRCVDAEGFGHIARAYVLVGPTFTTACIVNYLEQDAEDVLPLIQRTLDSITALPKKPAGVIPRPEGLPR